MIINSKTILTGLFANPAKHSLSPIIHNSSFKKLGLNYTYLSFEVENNNLENAINSLRALSMRGVNISMPYKSEVIKYLDFVDETANLIQSVNTIVNDNGYLKGYSSDGYGFIKSLEDENIFLNSKKATILGLGGASYSIILAMCFENIKEINIFSRSGKSFTIILDNIKNKYNKEILVHSLYDRELLKKSVLSSDILINTTPVGMIKGANKDNLEYSLIEDKSFFREELIVYDCIYNPIETKLLRIAKECNCKTINGLGMLIHQGALSFNMWTNYDMPTDYIKDILKNNIYEKNC